MHTPNPKLVELVTTALKLDEAATIRQLNHVRATAPAAGNARRQSPPYVGEFAWANAFGATRRGVVVKVTKTKAHVAYVTPASPGIIRVAVVPHANATVDA